MHLSSETRQIMDSLGNYVKRGEMPQLPGVRRDRLAQYRRLVRNVFDGTLRQAYPITGEVLPGEEWDELVDAFMANHQAQSYQVWKMPFEFYEFVKRANFSKKFNKPYLNDLLYFEWIEIEVFTMPEAPISTFQSEGDFLTDYLILNNDYRLIELQYPVFKMPAAETIDKKGNYFLLVLRKIDTGIVQFIEVTPFLGLLWETLNNDTLSGIDALLLIAKQIGVDSAEDLIPLALPFLNDLLLQGGILGFRKSI